MVEKTLLMASLLVLFGLAYNRVVGYLEEHKLIEGFVWVAVVAGVAVTLAVVTLLWWSVELTGGLWALVTLIGFAASGLPMACGSIWRYVSARRADQESMRADQR